MGDNKNTNATNKKVEARGTRTSDKDYATCESAVKRKISDVTSATSSQADISNEGDTNIEKKQIQNAKSILKTAEDFGKLKYILLQKGPLPLDIIKSTLFPATCESAVKRKISDVTSATSSQADISNEGDTNIEKKQIQNAKSILKTAEDFGELQYILLQKGPVPPDVIKSTLFPATCESAVKRKISDVTSATSSQADISNEGDTNIEKKQIQNAKSILKTAEDFGKLQYILLQKGPVPPDIIESTLFPATCESAVKRKRSDVTSSTSSQADISNEGDTNIEKKEIQNAKSILKTAEDFGELQYILLQKGPVPPDVIKSTLFPATCESAVKRKISDVTSATSSQADISNEGDTNIEKKQIQNAKSILKTAEDFGELQYILLQKGPVPPDVIKSTLFPATCESAVKRKISDVTSATSSQADISNEGDTNIEKKQIQNAKSILKTAEDFGELQYILLQKGPVPPDIIKSTLFPATCESAVKRKRSDVTSSTSSQADISNEGDTNIEKKEIQNAKSILKTAEDFGELQYILLQKGPVPPDVIKSTLFPATCESAVKRKISDVTSATSSQADISNEGDTNIEKKQIQNAKSILKTAEDFGELQYILLQKGPVPPDVIKSTLFPATCESAVKRKISDVTSATSSQADISNEGDTNIEKKQIQNAKSILKTAEDFGELQYILLQKGPVPPDVIKSTLFPATCESAVKRKRSDVTSSTSSQADISNEGDTNIEKKEIQNAKSILKTAEDFGELQYILLQKGPVPPDVIKSTLFPATCESAVKRKISDVSSATSSQADTSNEGDTNIEKKQIQNAKSILKTAEDFGELQYILLQKGPVPPDVIKSTLFPATCESAVKRKISDVTSATSSQADISNEGDTNIEKKQIQNAKSILKTAEDFGELQYILLQKGPVPPDVIKSTLFPATCESAVKRKISDVTSATSSQADISNEGDTNIEKKQIQNAKSILKTAEDFGELQYILLQKGPVPPDVIKSTLFPATCESAVKRKISDVTSATSSQADISNEGDTNIEKKQIQNAKSILKTAEDFGKLKYILLQKGPLPLDIIKSTLFPATCESAVKRKISDVTSATSSQVDISNEGDTNIEKKQIQNAKSILKTAEDFGELQYILLQKGPVPPDVIKSTLFPATCESAVKRKISDVTSATSSQADISNEGDTNIEKKQIQNAKSILKTAEDFGELQYILLQKGPVPPDVIKSTLFPATCESAVKRKISDVTSATSSQADISNEGDTNIEKKQIQNAKSILKTAEDFGKLKYILLQKGPLPLDIIKSTLFPATCESAVTRKTSDVTLPNSADSEDEDDSLPDLSSFLQCDNMNNEPKKISEIPIVATIDLTAFPYTSMEASIQHPTTEAAVDKSKVTSATSSEAVSKDICLPNHSKMSPQMTDDDKNKTVSEIPTGNQSKDDEKWKSLRIPIQYKILATIDLTSYPDTSKATVTRPTINRTSKWTSSASTSKSNSGNLSICDKPYPCGCTNTSLPDLPNTFQQVDGIYNSTEREKAKRDSERPTTFPQLDGRYNSTECEKAKRGSNKPTNDTPIHFSKLKGLILPIKPTILDLTSTIFTTNPINSWERNIFAGRSQATRADEVINVGDVNDYPADGKDLFKNWENQAGMTLDYNADFYNEEMLVTVHWRLFVKKKFTVRRYQKIKWIFTFFADKEKVDIKTIFLKFNSMVLHWDDTPDSFDYATGDIIVGNFLRYEILYERHKMYDLKKPDSVLVKFQFKALEPVQTYMGKNDQLIIPMIKCAEYLEISIQSLKFYFDGDLLRGSEKPSELEFEDGDCIDVNINK